ncbi:hypothetical protein [Pleionea sediminis]|uniref:hypothetical protein n=1 Tax=Pleionea sediminis TaxID=2569479 RepID=UPI00118726F5|nr:hypothetical protein [Pleionea sediminis]
MYTSKPIVVEDTRFSRKHHRAAYQALVIDLSRGDTFERRKSLDSWLKSHGHPLSHGENWEKVNGEFDWSYEYRQVVQDAMINGFFYSDAFQKQLFHCYIETGRLTLEKQEQITRQVELSLRANNKKGSAKNPFWTLWVALIAVILPMIHH